MTPEGTVKAKVKRILKEHGAYWFCPVQNGMGAPGLDFHCVHMARAFFIETKAPGKKPTPRQINTMRTIAQSGGVCFVIDGQRGYDELEKWMENVEAWEAVLNEL